MREKQVSFCKGCLACLKLGHCIIQDDAVEIAAKMHDADVLVFATPVYYYCVSGQLKTMLDRANPLFDTDYAFTKAYLLATAAEDAPETFEGTEKAVQGWVDCFPRCALAGTAGEATWERLPVMSRWSKPIGWARMSEQTLPVRRTYFKTTEVKRI